jgi:hypothetical protein
MEYAPVAEVVVEATTTFDWSASTKAPLIPVVEFVIVPAIVPTPTLKATPLLVTPPTVITTEPVTAPVGTGVTTLVSLHVFGLAMTPLKVTELPD